MIITFNEAHILAKTLQSVSWASEIIIVDSGSTDGTVEVARAHGARVLHRAFDGYGAQKHFAVQQATHDWILSLDADELVSEELGREIRELLRTEPPHRGYRFPISLVFMGRMLRYSGEYNKKFLRLFDRRAGNFTTDQVHERIQLQGTIGTLQQRVYHYSYENLSDFLEKQNRYSSLSAQKLLLKGKKASALKTVLRFPLTFLRIYVLRFGVLDGYPGFMWAMVMAAFTTTKYAKLREIALS
ncbi:glycosyltransferase [Rhabdobacter roseus]|uniref:glycosyltransferase n=1 Tax=Rhabdobacter roseus TaxID=1655419 RepID=UPI001614815C